MRCYICNKAIDDPEWDRLHNDFSPCGGCQAEINDLLESYRDVPFITFEVYDDEKYYPLAQPEPLKEDEE